MKNSTLGALGKQSGGNAKCTSPTPGAVPANVTRNIETLVRGASTTRPNTRVPTALSYAALNPQACDDECDSDGWGPADPWII